MAYTLVHFQKVHLSNFVLFFVLFSSLFSRLSPIHAQVPFEDELTAGFIQEVLSTEKKPLKIAERKIYAPKVLQSFYSKRLYAPVWNNEVAIQQLIVALHSAVHEGLTPEDYHLQAILTLHRKIKENKDKLHQAERDILMTDAALTYASHLLWGKTDPAKLLGSWNIEPKPLAQDTLAMLEEAIRNRRLPHTLERLKPQAYPYRHLKKYLAWFRRLATETNWENVHFKETLKPHMTHENVPALRRRLAHLGYAADTLPEVLRPPYRHAFLVLPARRIADSLLRQAAEPPLPDYAPLPPMWEEKRQHLNDSLLIVYTENAKFQYDSLLQEAVRCFQRAYGLADDAEVGKKTLEALNQSPQEAIDRICINLERMRWTFRSLEQNYVIVNIAGFELFVYKNDQIYWKTKVMVGRPYRKTPVFRAEIDHIVLNPTWTVPPGILRGDIFPKLRRGDLSYLSSHNMQVLSRQGQVLNPASIDWPTALKTRPFPYIFRQPPGDDNALGRIKLMFPNPHAVYLHDTPSKHLFDRSSRAFSSGCVRVQDPFRLAKILLNDPEVWTDEKFANIRATDAVTRVNLPEKWPLYLMYWTAGVDETGNIYFREDIYERDAKLLEALKRGMQ